MNHGLRSASIRAAIQKRHEQQEDGDDAESHDAQMLAFKTQHVTGQQLQRVEHRQEVPLRPDAGGDGREWVRFLPKLPRIEERQRREHGKGHVPGEDVTQDVVREEGHLAHPFSRPQVLLDAARNAHALPLDEQQVRSHKRRRDGGQHGHVEPEEPRQRRARHVVTTAQQSQKKRAGERHAAGDTGSNLRGEERQLVPWKEVAAETEAEHQKQQQHA